MLCVYSWQALEWDKNLGVVALGEVCECAFTANSPIDSLEARRMPLGLGDSTPLTLWGGGAPPGPPLPPWRTPNKYHPQLIDLELYKTKGLL